MLLENNWPRVTHVGCSPCSRSEQMSSPPNQAGPFSISLVSAAPLSLGNKTLPLSGPTFSYTGISPSSFHRSYHLHPWFLHLKSLQDPFFMEALLISNMLYKVLIVHLFVKSRTAFIHSFIHLLPVSHWHTLGIEDKMATTLQPSLPISLFKSMELRSTSIIIKTWPMPSRGL